MTFVFSILAIVILLVLLGIVFMRSNDLSFRKRAGFEYVYVEADGSVRELHPDEIEYLKEELSLGDYGEAFIKYNYRQLNGDKELCGFIKRVRVPRKIKIRALAEK